MCARIFVNGELNVLDFLSILMAHASGHAGKVRILALCELGLPSMSRTSLCLVGELKVRVPDFSGL